MLYRMSNPEARAVAPSSEVYLWAVAEGYRDFGFDDLTPLLKAQGEARKGLGCGGYCDGPRSTGMRTDCLTSVACHAELLGISLVSVRRLCESEVGRGCLLVAS
jgi:hypothetical protein